MKNKKSKKPRLKYTPLVEQDIVFYKRKKTHGGFSYVVYHNKVYYSFYRFRDGKSEFHCCYRFPANLQKKKKERCNGKIVLRANEDGTFSVNIGDHKEGCLKDGTPIGWPISYTESLPPFPEDIGKKKKTNKVENSSVDMNVVKHFQVEMDERIDIPLENVIFDDIYPNESHFNNDIDCIGINDSKEEFQIPVKNVETGSKGGFRSILNEKILKKRKRDLTEEYGNVFPSETSVITVEGFDPKSCEVKVLAIVRVFFTLFPNVTPLSDMTNVFFGGISSIDVLKVKSVKSYKNPTFVDSLKEKNLENAQCVVICECPTSDCEKLVDVKVTCGEKISGICEKYQFEYFEKKKKENKKNQKQSVKEDEIDPIIFDDSFLNNVERNPYSSFGSYDLELGEEIMSYMGETPMNNPLLLSFFTHLWKENKRKGKLEINKMNFDKSIILYIGKVDIFGFDIVCHFIARGLTHLVKYVSELKEFSFELVDNFQNNYLHWSYYFENKILIEFFKKKGVSQTTENYLGLVPHLFQRANIREKWNKTDVDEEKLKKNNNEIGCETENSNFDLGVFKKEENTEKELLTNMSNSSEISDKELPKDAKVSGELIKEGNEVVISNSTDFPTNDIISSSNDSNELNQQTEINESQLETNELQIVEDKQNSLPNEIDQDKKDKKKKTVIICVLFSVCCSCCVVIMFTLIIITVVIVAILFPLNTFVIEGDLVSYTSFGGRRALNLDDVDSVFCACVDCGNGPQSVAYIYPIDSQPGKKRKRFRASITKDHAWVVAFINSREKGMDMIKGYLAPGKMNSILPFSNSNSSHTFLGNVTIHTNRVANISLDSLSQLLKDINMSFETADSIGKLDKFMLWRSNPDVDEVRGVDILEDSKSFRENPFALRLYPRRFPYIVSTNSISLVGSDFILNGSVSNSKIISQYLRLGEFFPSKDISFLGEGFHVEICFHRYIQLFCINAEYDYNCFDYEKVFVSWSESGDCPYNNFTYIINSEREPMEDEYVHMNYVENIGGYRIGVGFNKDTIQKAPSGTLKFQMYRFENDSNSFATFTFPFTHTFDSLDGVDGIIVPVFQFESDENGIVRKINSKWKVFSKEKNELIKTNMEYVKSVLVIGSEVNFSFNPEGSWGVIVRIFVSELSQSVDVVYGVNTCCDPNAPEIKLEEITYASVSYTLRCGITIHIGFWDWD